MNYLAHLYLADPTAESLLGNLLADVVKGNEIAALPENIQEGIQMHRQVDAFTDRHPLVQRSICRISENWNWYSGILVDMYYDHILATTWELYSSEKLRAYVERIQQFLLEGVQLVPACREMIASLIRNDRLFSYSTPKGIEEALVWISGRLHEMMPDKDVHLERAMPELQANHAGLAEDFRGFFPELIKFAQGLRKKSD
jgi:acyl carrier protein phosphodiesterase